MATLSFQRAISGGALGEGAAISIAMVPFLLAAIMFSYFGLQRRAWQQGGGQMSTTRAAEPTHATTGRHGLSRDAVAQARDDLSAAGRLPVRAAVPVLLDGDHVGEARPRAAVAHRQPVLGARADAGALRQAAVPHLVPGVDVEHGAGLGGRHLLLARLLGVRRLRDRAAALLRRQAGRPVDLPRLPGAAVDPVHPAGGDRLPARPVRHALGADPHLPDVPDPVLRPGC